MCASNSFDNIVLSLDSLGARYVYHVVPMLEKIKDNLSARNDWAAMYIAFATGSADSTIYKLSVVITEHCTLRCKYCAEYMPYIKNPKHTSVRDVVFWIDSLLEAIGEIRQLHLMGGEVFTHPEWDKIVERLLNDSRIGKIILLTNATVVPRTIDVLQNERVKLELDDYPCGRIDELESFCDRNNIEYSVVKHDYWYDLTSKEIKDNECRAVDRYSRCRVKGCWCISDGFLYRCTTSYYLTKYANGTNPYGDTDFINLKRLSASEIRMNIRRLAHAKFLNSCTMCPGTKRNNIVTVADQLDIHSPMYKSMTGYEEG